MGAGDLGVKVTTFVENHLARVSGALVRRGLVVLHADEARAAVDDRGGDGEAVSDRVGSSPSELP